MLTDKHGYHHLTGCIHMHTPDSDGTKTHPEVTALAREVGLDYLIFTDHMTLKSREAQERFHDGLLAIVGYEHNDRDDRNHYLLLNSPRVYDSHLSAAEYVAQGAADSALGFIAHPDEQRPYEGKFPPYPWVDWSAEGFTGIEIWNQMSDWMERLEKATFPGKVALLFSPRKFMKSPPAATLRRWDELSLVRRITGIGGVDAHGFPYRLGFKTLTIFPYKVHFRSLRTHLLLAEPLASDASQAKDQVLRALSEARVYFSNHRRGDAEGFLFRGHQDGKTVISGGILDKPEGATLEALTPAKAEIRLLCNGQIVARTESTRLEFSVSGPGAYRVEVRRSGKGWIFSNHIRIGL